MLPGQVPGRRSRCPCLEACPPPTPMCCGPPAPAVANVNRGQGQNSGSDQELFLLPPVCRVRSQAIATYHSRSGFQHSHNGSVPVWIFDTFLHRKIRFVLNRTDIACAKIASWHHINLSGCWIYRVDKVVVSLGVGSVHRLFGT